MFKRNDNKNVRPTLAPGMDNHEELDQNATENEIANGEYTSVTTLSYDEIDPSK